MRTVTRPASVKVPTSSEPPFSRAASSCTDGSPIEQPVAVQWQTMFTEQSSSLTEDTIRLSPPFGLCNVHAPFDVQDADQLGTQPQKPPPSQIGACASHHCRNGSCMLIARRIRLLSTRAPTTGYGRPGDSEKALSEMSMGSTAG